MNRRTSIYFSFKIDMAQAKLLLGHLDCEVGIYRAGLISAFIYSSLLKTKNQTNKSPHSDTLST